MFPLMMVLVFGAVFECFALLVPVRQPSPVPVRCAEVLGKGRKAYAQVQHLPRWVRCADVTLS